MEKIEIARSVFFFILAGLCEIGGGYLVWLWLREEKSVLDWVIRSNCAGYLRNYTNLPARKFWPGIRGLWRGIHRSFHSLGMED